MKILALTSKLETGNGWGRYSLGLIGALRDSGVEVVIAEDGISLPNTLNYNKNYFLALWYALKLVPLARECQFIHVFAEPYVVIANLLSKFTGKPYIVTVHGSYGVLPYNLPIKKYFHGKSLADAQTLVCVSNYTKEVMSSYKLKNLVVIPNGIDLNVFTGSNPPFAEREDLMISVGALKYRKGQHVALVAFTNLVKSHPQLRYILVGSQDDAVYTAKLKKIVEDAGLENKVDFLSHISDGELLALYRRAKVFVLTSISTPRHFEGFGLVYLEANACGLPAIGSRRSGAEDAIRDNKTGFLVYQEDVSDVTQKVEKMLTDRDLWHQMSREGLVWARKHGWKEIAKEYVKIYGFK